MPLICVGGDTPSILVSVSPSDDNVDFCGLCGSRTGTLLKPDGTEVDRNDVNQREEFARCYVVEPREQILRPQRTECGTSISYKTVLLVFCCLQA